jgi:cytochrome c5
MRMTTQNGLAIFLPAHLLRILLAMPLVAVACYFLSRLHDSPPTPELMTYEMVSVRLQPVAHVFASSAGPAEPGAARTAPLLKGQAVYEAVCVACHGEGIAGAPRFGDRKAWVPRIAQGFSTLVKHAIEGYTGKSGMMPPKGGSGNEDVEIARAVAYMASKAGASFPEPESLGKK